MATAIILVNVKRDAVNETAQALTDMDGISEVYSVAGEWDLVAIIRARDSDQMAELVTSRMLKLDAIEKTTTLVAFRAYSRHDLERMFSVGFEEG